MPPIYHAEIMRTSPISVLLALGACLAGCQSLNDAMKNAPQPSARVVGASLQGLTLERVDLVFDVEVTNPYPANLPLTDLAYTVASSGQTIAEGAVKPSGSIPAHGSKVLQIPAGIRFASLTALKGVRPGSVVPYTADLKLGVNAPVLGAVTLPLSHRGEVPVPAVPDVSMTSFDVSALSLDKVQATAKMRIKNNNQFDLDISKLGLDLALGGHSVGGTSVTNAGKLAPGQESTVAVPLSFSPKELGVGLFNLLRGSESGYSVNGVIETDTRFGTVKLPFDRNGSTRISR